MPTETGLKQQRRLVIEGVPGGHPQFVQKRVKKEIDRSSSRMRCEKNSSFADDDVDDVVVDDDDHHYDHYLLLVLLLHFVIVNTLSDVYRHISSPFPRQLEARGRWLWWSWTLGKWWKAPWARVACFSFSFFDYPMGFTGFRWILTFVFLGDFSSFLGFLSKSKLGFRFLFGLQTFFFAFWVFAWLLATLRRRVHFKGCWMFTTVQYQRFYPFFLKRLCQRNRGAC